MKPRAKGIPKKTVYFTDVLRRDVAFVGLRNSGKTVLITSLIEQIRRRGFKDEGSPTSNFQIKTLPSNDKANEFPYHAYRSELAEKFEWPGKTVKPYLIKIEFIDKNLNMKVELTLHDIPGERVNDMAIVSERNYVDWSRKMWNHLEVKAEIETEEYLSLLQTDVEESTITACYKKMLGRLLGDYRSLISPSSFLLDLKGDPIPQGSLDEWIAKRYTGLSPEQQFAPLPLEAMKRFPLIAKAFEQNYNAYRQYLKESIFDRLGKCHQVFVLVDVPGLLCANDRAYNDTKWMMESLFNACVPQRNIVSQFGRTLLNAVLPHSYRLRGIEKFGVIGSKADLVKNSDMDKLSHLLDMMTRHHLEDASTYGVDVRTFNCAAVRSTEPAPKESEYDLIGFLKIDEEGKACPRPTLKSKPHGFRVSALPGDWPRAWDVGTYQFPIVYPDLPVNSDLPPENNGLHEIYRFITRSRLELEQ